MIKGIRILMTITCLLVFLITPLFADSATNPYLARGIQLYNNGSYREAISELKQGIQQGADNQTLAQMELYLGASYQFELNNTLAKEAFRNMWKYTNGVPPDITGFSPDIRKIINEVRNDIKGQLMITCEPVECNVYINNVNIGSTRFSQFLVVGEYNIKLVPFDLNYKSYSGNAIIAYNKKTEMRISLVPSGTNASTQAKVNTYNSAHNNNRNIYSGMSLVPAGDFQMGCSGDGCMNNAQPQHNVYLDDFWIDTNDVTVAQYKACVDAGVCAPPAQYAPQFEADNNPIVGVTWYDAYNYCKWVGKRLPTEAEWEKAARGTNAFVYPWGSSHPTTSFAAYGNEDFPDPVGNHPQGASPYGVMDMAGNVWQWVNDWYAPDYYAKSPDNNPYGPSTTGFKVIRGGSFASNAYNITTYNRAAEPPDFYYDNLGFRCAVGGGK
jgi:formylglycine-generating enzyme required for sulfatase activity